MSNNTRFFNWLLRRENGSNGCGTTGHPRIVSTVQPLEFVTRLQHVGIEQGEKVPVIISHVDVDPKCKGIKVTLCDADPALSGKKTKICDYTPTGEEYPDQIIWKGITPDIGKDQVLSTDICVNGVVEITIQSVLPI
jgi:hypothetical protein